MSTVSLKLCKSVNQHSFSAIHFEPLYIEEQYPKRTTVFSLQKYVQLFSMLDVGDDAGIVQSCIADVSQKSTFLLVL